MGLSMFCFVFLNVWDQFGDVWWIHQRRPFDSVCPVNLMFHLLTVNLMSMEFGGKSNVGGRQSRAR